MSMVTPRPLLGQKVKSLRHTGIERRYYKWLHDNCCCVLTGYKPFDIAHTGGLSQGKGMATKAALHTCLPLRRELHLIEERSRKDFWAQVGLPDHLAWAERLYDNFETGDDPTTLLLDMQEQANRSVIASMLSKCA